MPSRHAPRSAFHPAPHGDADRERVGAALIRSTGTLTTSAMARMEAEMSWFADLSAEDRSWVGVIVSSGIRDFVEWYRRGERHAGSGQAVAASVFGAAPRALAGAITLQQTVDLVRLSIEVVEQDVDRVVDADDLAEVHGVILRYAREVAFATAEVYARAAEARGAWDARLEALVVDAVVRAETDETVLSRASALGWAARGDVAVVLATVPNRGTESDLFDAVRREAGAAGMDALCAAQGDRLVVLLGGVRDLRAGGSGVATLVADGPVVVGPAVDDLAHAHVSARVALAAHRAAPGWPDAPRPVLADELLPERALSGDGHARRQLVEDIFLPLAARSELLETLSAYFDQGGSIEGTARVLFVHPNTVRYRLRAVAETTGCTPREARDALTLRIALVLGRQSGRAPTVVL